MKFQFDMCHFTVDNDIGTGRFLLAPGILHVCGHTKISPGMDCNLEKALERVVVRLKTMNYGWICP